VTDHVDHVLGTVIRGPNPATDLPRPIPPEIRGWMFSYELRWLYDQAKSLQPGDLLEVGSFRGLSASALGQAGKLTCVDTFRGGNDLPEEDTFADFQKTMRTMGLSPEVRRGRSDRVLPELMREGRCFALVFIDGSHEYADARKDIALGWDLLRWGGLLVVDDYDFPDVGAACDNESGRLGFEFHRVHPTRSKMVVAVKP
jgi:predicted O-methyltransferase YrrM